MLRLDCLAINKRSSFENPVEHLQSAISSLTGLLIEDDYLIDHLEAWGKTSPQQKYVIAWHA